MLKHVIILAVAVLFDYISKYWIVHHLTYQQSIRLFNAQFFGVNLFLTHNSGIAFGLFHRGQQANLWFLLLTVTTIIFIAFLLIKKKITDHTERLAMVLILSGAIGNALDRIIYGHVIDFIDFYLIFSKIPYHWYTFNIADCVICIGTLLFTYKIIRG